MFFSKNRNQNEESLNQAPKEFSNGSRDAFKLLYETYGLKVYRYCLKVLGDEAKAKDAFQETFSRVFENYQKFDGQNFQAWLFRIARNNCLNQFRSKREIEEYDEFIHYAATQDDTEDVGLKEAVIEAVENLPEKYKEAFILREYEELTYQEISEILNIELSLAKIRVFRARNILRKVLEPVVKEMNEIR
jgi:RNA polymerase sigma-70 factor (ECF subfamily)